MTEHIKDANANAAEQAALAAAGFSFEHPGIWMRNDETADGKQRSITIADGESCNCIMWEVQFEIDGESILGTEAFANVDEAIAMVSREIAEDQIDDLFDRSSWPPERRSGCPECARSFGPNYSGPCTH